MALRTKTVEFPFATNTASLNAATRHDFAAITLDIPENTSRTFRSVFIEVICCDHVTATTSISSRLLGIKLGAVAFNDESISDFIQDSGARERYRFTRDVTSYFNTNFGSGTSQTCQVGVQFGGIATQSICAKIIATYEFDDAAQSTRVKTVKIPIDGNTGRLTNSLVELGTNQVPALDTFLPEASKSYKQIWFEVMASESNAGVTTDFNLDLALDAESAVSMGTLEMAKNNSTCYSVIWVRNDMTTNTTHALKASSSTTSRMGLLGGMLCVTYTYDHSTTTSVLNSLSIPMPTITSVIKANDGTTGAYRSELKFFIEEPGTITLRQSGVIVKTTQADAATGTYNLRCGSQSYRAYTFNPSSNAGDAGHFTLWHRIDSGAAAGSAGITLARGENTFNLDYYFATNIWASVNSSACLILNYTSDVATGGADTHNHTTRWLVQRSQITTNNSFETASGFSPSIAESNYYTTAVGYLYINTMSANSGATVLQALSAERLSGEGAADGWQNIVSSFSNIGYPTTIENFIDASPLFDRHPSDPDGNRLALEGSRKYRFHTTRNSNALDGIACVEMIINYHAITFTIAGVVTGYTGDGSGITVKVHRSDNDEYVTSGTTSTGGTFSITWYDSAITVYCQARQDSTHRGRSDNSNAV